MEPARRAARRLVAAGEPIGRLGPGTDKGRTPPELYLEVRSKGARVGQPNTEQRVYTTVSPADPEHPNEANMFMEHNYSLNGYQYQSVITWTPDEFDPVARIASGRFAFKLYEPGGCDTLRVTNGRFDVKF